MGFAEKRGDYYRARYKAGPGKYPAVKDATGATVKYRTKRDAEQAANDKEAEVRAGRWKDPSAGEITFGAYANRRYAGLDLAASTMQNYRRHLEEHLLPEFEDWALADISTADVDAWEVKEKAAGYAVSSVKTWRTTLHTFLADAVEDGLIGANPAAKRRGKGKRAGRSRSRGPEKTIVDARQALLIAERAALLAGRDDEFVLVVMKYFTGMRWAELIGLETKYARLGSARVEHQLYELDTGELLRCPPKDDSYRDVDLPGWLSALISDHLARTAPRPCECHNLTYVFSGRHDGAPRDAGRVTIREVAERASVSVATVSAAMNHPERLAAGTLARVEAVIRELDFVPGAGSVRRAAHWRRSGFASWVFHPAATGWFPPKAPQKARPVPVVAEPWPGAPVRGRNSQGRATASWLPIAAGLTPHGLRHSLKTLMAEVRTPEVLSHERLGHEMEGIAGRYSHVTDAMRKELMEELTARWLTALDARAAMHPGSPVAVLDELLQARGRKKKGDDTKIVSQNSPSEGVSPLRARPRKGA